MYQKVIILGNLGRDPEMKFLPDGTAVTRFSVACNRKWQDGEETIWFNVSVFGAQAEPCNQYLAKGRQCLVEGRLTPDKQTGSPRIWEGNDGQPRASYELRAISVQFLGGGSQRDNGQSGQAAPSEKTEPDTIAEDDIPF